MAGFLQEIIRLIQLGEVRISEHGYDKLVACGLTVREMIDGADEAIVVEEYQNYSKGPCVLVFQVDDFGAPVHALWGIPRGLERPAVLITAYRPDPERWSRDFLRRQM